MVFKTSETTKQLIKMALRLFEFMRRSSSIASILLLFSLGSTNVHASFIRRFCEGAIGCFNSICSNGTKITARSHTTSSPTSPTVIPTENGQRSKAEQTLVTLGFENWPDNTKASLSKGNKWSVITDNPEIFEASISFHIVSSDLPKQVHITLNSVSSLESIGTSILAQIGATLPLSPDKDPLGFFHAAFDLLVAGKFDVFVKLAVSTPDGLPPIGSFFSKLHAKVQSESVFTVVFVEGSYSYYPLYNYNWVNYRNVSSKFSSSL